jgi:hypothetical protein
MTPQQTKDLLIHAAKAAGLEGYTFQEETPLQSAMMVRRNIDEHGWDIGVQDFDPINNDGDAFKLQVKLKMDVNISHRTNEVIVFTMSGNKINRVDGEWSLSFDEYAATRLAITKAAAMTEGWKE